MCGNVGLVMSFTGTNFLVVWKSLRMARISPKQLLSCHNEPVQNTEKSVEL